MKEETNWKKFLTENVLGECWDANKRPGGDLPNRTFDNQDDMMKLYRAIHWEGNWTAFTVYSNNIWWQNCDRPYDTVEQAMADYNSYLLCFGDKDYESRCKMVAKFYGWEEEKKS